MNNKIFMDAKPIPVKSEASLFRQKDFKFFKFEFICIITIYKFEIVYGDSNYPI